MATLQNITSPIWGLSTIGYGVIVEGIAAIRQRMDIAIRTTRGTDPLRPEFGSLVFKFVDAPVNVAVPNVKKELLDALQIWVPEIKVISIRHTFATDYNPVFEIAYRIVDEDVIDKLLFDLREGVTTVTDELNEIILQAFFPPNPNNYRYKIKLIKNGNQVFPLPNPYGYTTINNLFQWVQANWFYLGRFYLLADKIVCYMSSEGVTSATMAIELVSLTRVEADFPQLAPGQSFNVVYKENGVPVVPAMPNFSTPGQVLAFANSNWSNYASFSIEFLSDDGNAIFADEFSDEFAIASTGYKLIGVTERENVNPELEISTI